MCPLGFAIDRLADVVQESCTLRQFGVESKLGSHQRTKHRDFFNVSKYVLPVTRSVIEFAHEVNDVIMEAVKPKLEASLFAGFAHHNRHLFLSLFDYFFDARRMDAAVRDQLLKRHAGDLAAYRVVGGENDGFRRIVHYYIHSRKRLK